MIARQSRAALFDVLTKAIGNGGIYWGEHCGEQGLARGVPCLFIQSNANRE